jgi:hypothetical protein
MRDRSTLRHGAFIAYEPRTYPGNPQWVIPFRFNPEALSRSLQVEAAKTGAGTESAAGGGGSSTTEQGADASTGATKETLTVQIRLDLVDRRETSQALTAQYGILPEISALESLVYPALEEQEPNSDGREPVMARSPRPTVLFVWGLKRILPVRVVSMTINETSHSADLYPVRAEIDVGLEVLGLTDAKDNAAVLDALKFTNGVRRSMAKKYLATTADQGDAFVAPLKAKDVHE